MTPDTPGWIPIVGPIIGGGIAGTIGFAVAWWKRRRDGQDRFLAVLGELRAELDGVGHIDSRTEVFHATSLPLLRQAIFAVQPFVCACRFERMLALWHDYKQVDARAGSALGARTAHELQHGAQSPTMPPYPVTQLQDFLARFRKEVR